MHRLELALGRSTLSIETAGSPSKRRCRGRPARRHRRPGHGLRAEGSRGLCDFLPLTVDYRENTYAAGKIPGGFFKREGRPNEKEILTSG